MKRIALSRVVEITGQPIPPPMRTLGAWDAERTWVHETAAGPVVIWADTLAEAVRLLAADAAPERRAA